MPVSESQRWLVAPVELVPLLPEALPVAPVLPLGLPELCATDTVANPASAAAIAMPSTFFIMLEISKELVGK
jgi:hypothetical protein